jgi:hypothetical protein
MCTGMNSLQPVPSIQGNEFFNVRDVGETELGEISDSNSNKYEDDRLL